VSVAVDGDTDKEYKIVVRNLNTSQALVLLLNNDSTANNYGQQYILNNAGTISAARSTNEGRIAFYRLGSVQTTTLLTPTGFIKTAFNEDGQSTSGTTVSLFMVRGYSYNSTNNITSLNFVSASGNFTSGTRITVYARRSNV
jgi:hypothetical protein